jgi:tetratricopeptide (TPR) repeat protein
MKSPMTKSIKTVLIVLFLLLFSCATPGPVQQYTPGSVIDRGDYSLTGPPGDGWSVKIEGGVIQFYRATTRSGSDRILIMAARNDFDAKKGRYPSEEEVAFEFINLVEKSQKENAKKGHCVLNEIKKGTTVVGEKKLHFVSTRTSSWKGGPARKADVLYIFFPPDFKERHGFFNFQLIQVSNAEEALEEVDLKLIMPVIDSLKLKEKIEVEPKDPKTYFQMGLAHVQKRDFDQAILYFNKAIELDPKNPIAYNNRGGVYMAKGQYDRAISDWTKALEIDPKYASAYYNLGYANCIKGQYDEAILYLNKALEIDPRHYGAYNERGIAHAEKGEYDQAISDYDKAIEINPKYTKAYYNRGRAYYLKKEYDKSWNDVNKLKELGYKIPPEFLNQLRKASGREK